MTVRRSDRGEGEDRVRTDEPSVRRVIDSGAFTTVFQPIYCLRTGRLLGVEALTRVTLGAVHAPAVWLSEAHRVGLGTELELVVLRHALASGTSLPRDLTLAVNLSPVALTDERVSSVLLRHADRNLVVELTEQPALHLHPQLLRQREQLRDAHIELAVGNVAARRTSMARLLALRPGQVKTERWLSGGIERDAHRRVVARKLLRVAHHAGAQVVAEGVETEAQLEAWRLLGADAAQGFLLGTPAPLTEALQRRSIPLD